ncbi:MAG: glycine/betaine ABC transporter, partial [Chloroflexota bacterium]
VTNPKDDYVADFVQGISRLGLVHAETVMQPIDAYKALPDALDLTGSPSVPLTANLDQLIDVAADTDAPLIITEHDQPVGVITKKNLLNAIRGN